jgi:hypothetical protein
VESMYGNEGLRHIIFECCGHVLHGLEHFRRPKGLGEQIDRRLAGAVRVAIGHHHDHRLAILRCDQVVQDEIRVALANPSGLVFTGAMLQVEDRIACLGLCVVVWRQINQRMPPRPPYLRAVPNLPDLAVGQVLNRIK